MKAFGGRPRPIVVLCVAATCLVSGVAGAASWPRAVTSAAPDRALEARVHSIVADMTLEQKVGQITQAEIRSITPDDVRKYYIGSILNGGARGRR